MDQHAAMALSDLEKKIEALQEKKEAVLKKEKERKARAQEKWKALFLKEAMKGVTDVYGTDYEEVTDAVELAKRICRILSGLYEQEEAERSGGNAAGMNGQEEAERSFGMLQA